MRTEKETAAQLARALAARHEWDFSAVALLDKGAQRERAIDEYLSELGHPRGEAAREDYRELAKTMATIRDPVVRPAWILAQMAPGAPSPDLGVNFVIAVNPEEIGTRKIASAVASAIARRLRSELVGTAAGFAKKRRDTRRRDPFGDPMARLWDLACHRLHKRFELGAKEAVVLLERTAIASKRPGQLNSSAGVLYTKSHTRAAKLLAAPVVVFRAERQRIFNALSAELNRLRAKKPPRKK